LALLAQDIAVNSGLGTWILAQAVGVLFAMAMPAWLAQ